jgi:hypothetical protein
LYTILLTLSGPSTGKPDYDGEIQIDRTLRAEPRGYYQAILQHPLLPQAFKFGAGCMGFIKVWWAILLRGAQ